MQSQAYNKNKFDPWLTTISSEYKTEQPFKNEIFKYIKLQFREAVDILKIDLCQRCILRTFRKYWNWLFLSTLNFQNRRIKLLREKCPNTDLKKLCNCTFFAQWVVDDSYFMSDSISMKNARLISYAVKTKKNPIKLP